MAGDAMTTKPSNEAVEALRKLRCEVLGWVNRDSPDKALEIIDAAISRAMECRMEAAAREIYDEWELVPDNGAHANMEELLQARKKARASVADLIRQHVGEIEPTYVRFGEVPTSGKSRNALTKTDELGVSVYRAVRVDGQWCPVVPIVKGFEVNGLVSFSGVCCRPMYLVKGEETGIGGDGEPVLRNIVIMSSPNEEANIGGPE
jgi:hypothetical protein